ncbi:MAG: hypothetical protein PHH08_01520 [Candidatus ainarchaeum sp.]|nr:hypothetical protein [Candidatus ainarchaeum sp.]
MNKQGFNLFTALVSFLFITLTVLLWQSMIQSERKTSDMFRANEERAKIEAIADNAVTDAVQTFNYTLRKKTADYVSPKSGDDPFELPEEHKWPKVINDFVESKFGSAGNNTQQFASGIAGDLKYYFANTWNFKIYSIQVENVSNTDTLTLVLKDLVNRTIADQQFFNVVGCEGGNPDKCPLGTFYVNLDVTKLSPEDYEKLPRVVITSSATLDEVRHVILPKATFRIYVPLRLFKAFAEARGFAHFSETPNLDIDTQIMGTAGDIGFLSDKTTEEINSFQLGMCDRDYCAPRTSPFNAPAAKELSGTGCPGDPGIVPVPQKVMMPLNYSGCTWCNNVSQPLPATYNAHFMPSASGSADSGPNAIAEITASRVCALAKQASQKGYFAAEGTGPAVSFQPSPLGDCPDYIESELVRTDPLENKPPNSGKKQLFDSAIVPEIPPREVLVPFSSPESYRSYCTKPRRVEAVIAFTDNDPAYTIEQGRKMTYRVRLVNNNPILEQDSAGNPGDEGWKCVSKRTIPGGGFGTPIPTACRLPPIS